MTKNHTERKHALLGGSSAHRWSECPASVTVFGHIKQKESEAAKSGTKTHEVADILLTDFLEHKVSGADPDIRAHFFDDDEERFERAKSWVDAMWTKGLHEALTGKAYGIEENFILDKKLQMSGYIDFWAAYTDDAGKRAGVTADYKDGHYEVPIEKNPQLAFYATAMQEEFIQLGKPLDYVRGIIFQPKTSGYKETKFTKKQLLTWRKKFYKAATEILVEKSERYKTGEWCRFCPGNLQCEKYRAEMHKTTALSVIDPDDLEIPEPASVPDDVLVNVILNQDKLNSFIKAAKAYVIERHAAGNKLPGLKLVRGRTKRRWKKDGNFIVLQDLFGDDAFESKPLGIGRIEKLFKKSKYKAQADAVMSNLTEKPPGAISIVASSDIREEIKDNISLLSSLEDEDDNDD